MNVKTPCYECKDRKVGCHSICEKYKKYKIDLAEENKKKRKALDSAWTAGHSGRRAQYRPKNTKGKGFYGND